MKWIKRIGLSSSFIIILSLLLTGTVLATVFMSDITITNTSVTAYTYLPIIASSNNTYLSTNGYISANGTDVLIYNGATKLPRMLSDNRTLFVLPSLGSLGSSTVTYTTNNTPENFEIVTGYGGYVTIADNASLEPSNNCTFEFSVPVTSTSYNVTSKSGAFNILHDGSGNITARLDGGSYPVISSNTTGHSTAAISGIPVGMPAGVASGDGLLVLANTYNGTVTINTPAGWTQLYQTAGYGGSVSTMAAFWKVADGTETTTNFTTSAYTWDDWASFRVGVGTFNGTPVVGVTNTGNSVNPDPPNNTTGFGAVKTLFIAVENNFGAVTASSAPASYLYLMNSSELAGAGQNIGVAFRYLTAASDNPDTFTIGVPINWGAQTIAIRGLTVINSFSGLAIGTVATGSFIQDGVHAWFNINGSTSANTTAVSIPDNSSNCILNAPYYDYYKESVNGTMQIIYQPSSIILGTVMPNTGALGATGNGVITWGSNPSGITATMGSMTFSTTASSGTTITTPDVVGSTGGGFQNIHRPNEDLTMPGNELYPTVNTIATISNIPIVFLWWFLSFLCVIVVLGLVRKYSNSIFAAGLMAVIVMAVFCVLGASPTVPNSGGCLEWWQPAVVLLATITQVIVDRTYMM